MKLTHKQALKENFICDYCEQKINGIKSVALINIDIKQFPRMLHIECYDILLENAGMDKQ